MQQLSFILFVVVTLLDYILCIKKTDVKENYYAAGGKISGFQNGLAIAGDYMSAASFLGISGLVFYSGFDGLIYSIGFLSWMANHSVFNFRKIKKLR